MWFVMGLAEGAKTVLVDKDHSPEASLLPKAAPSLPSAKNVSRDRGGNTGVPGLDLG